MGLDKKETSDSIILLLQDFLKNYSRSNRKRVDGWTEEIINMHDVSVSHTQAAFAASV